MKYRLKSLIILITGLLLISACSQYKEVSEDLAFLTPDKFLCTVMQVKSGDTFLCQMSGLDNENIKLIGVSIYPDKQKEAKEYAKSILKRGTLVNIEPGNDIRDSHGNIPAYVFVPGGKMLNIMLAKKGLAEISIEEIGKYKSSFIEIQQNTQIEIINEEED
ncbi:MAG: hypothetical protein DHS20C13_22620 [Thermodesulfobacteriota bacterium]|nr:MAG: hypothetical protein DHS20C13_22620 [Thermodesulfobacteriota bacterium]